MNPYALNPSFRVRICLELHWLGRPMRGGDYETKAVGFKGFRVWGLGKFRVQGLGFKA